ncbi:hypothetical protein FJZ18_00690 [Candidatus Pacearchaeota archaeon]|nr:hypothetical protein [Candidatus Pacearchaeota archaeon]
MKKIVLFCAGFAILVFLFVSYFIPVYYTEIENGNLVQVESILLGEIIFQSPWILALHIFIAATLIFKSWMGAKIRFQ